MQTADFTIADVLAWARTKPAGETYDFTRSSVCAIAQFGRATNRDYLVGHLGTKIISGMPALNDALASALTFGGLVAELEKLCPETLVTQSDWAKLDAYMRDIESVEA